MSDGSASRVSKGNTGNYPGTPRWVKAFGIAILILVLVAVVVLVSGVGGEHGPGRHLGSGGEAGQAAPAAGVRQP